MQATRPGGGGKTQGSVWECEKHWLVQFDRDRAKVDPEIEGKSEHVGEYSYSYGPGQFSSTYQLYSKYTLEQSDRENFVYQLNTESKPQKGEGGNGLVLGAINIRY